jgi:hypothetical protein
MFMNHRAAMAEIARNEKTGGTVPTSPSFKHERVAVFVKPRRHRPQALVGFVCSTLSHKSRSDDPLFHQSHGRSRLVRISAGLTAPPPNAPVCSKAFPVSNASHIKPGVNYSSRFYKRAQRRSDVVNTFCSVNTRSSPAIIGCKTFSGSTL